MAAGLGPWSDEWVGAAISAVVAVAGTVLGAVLTYVFQERAARRAEASTLRRELRAERVNVYSSFLTALAEYRRGQLDWWWRREEDPRGEAALAAWVESYRLRGVAQAAFSQVQLVARNTELVAAASEAWELAHSVHRAEDRAELDIRADRVKEAVETFTALAAGEVQAGYDAGDDHRERLGLRLLDGWPEIRKAAGPTRPGSLDPDC